MGLQKGKGLESWLAEHVDPSKATRLAQTAKPEASYPFFLTRSSFGARIFCGASPRRTPGGFRAGILTHRQRPRTHTNPCTCHGLSPAMGMRMGTREEAISGQPDQTVPVRPGETHEAIQTVANSGYEQAGRSCIFGCISYLSVSLAEEMVVAVTPSQFIAANVSVN
jgi:hypothetical protein